MADLNKDAPRHWPLFIVGSARSGTSILTSGLLAAGYSGYREGHFLSLLRPFDATLERHVKAFGRHDDRVLAGRVDWAAFGADLHLLFKRYVEAQNPAAPWLDKTGGPDMIEAIPTLRGMWPEARFLFAKRRAIENIVSRLKKFPQHPFEKHCTEWARNMAAWRGVREALGPAAIEVDQQEIARAPAIVAARLAAFTGGGDAARLRMQTTFEQGRPQQTDAGSALRVIDLDSLNWNEKQLATFDRLCGEEMELFNYSRTSGYWLDASLASLA